MKAKFADLSELATFARLTYAAAFGFELGASTLQQHLELNMSDQNFEQMLAVDTFYLARKDSALVGFAQIGLVDPAYQEHVDDFEPSAYELRRLYVLNDRQSQGLGSKLLQQALQDPKIAVAKGVYLTTWQANHGAQKFYRKHEFNKVGQIPEYDAAGELNGYEHIMVYMH